MRRIVDWFEEEEVPVTELKLHNVRGVHGVVEGEGVQAYLMVGMVGIVFSNKSSCIWIIIFLIILHCYVKSRCYRIFLNKIILQVIKVVR